ncbi:hypothetical protein [Endozoicomonas sp. GU-1]|uniref:hypothetical protein n=1 Tax=Endozoicomonas sp. GU-1 TaxID=3009078 RepID=UPI0022B2C331|nr:hypothetical protein [Endozoicomonas sp. GU-1]WBA87986.1 hypothetical protein O3276_08280 [Endozoicomonas sp. GU-1]
MAMVLIPEQPLFSKVLWRFTQQHPAKNREKSLPPSLKKHKTLKICQHKSKIIEKMPYFQTKKQLNHKKQEFILFYSGPVFFY